MKRLNIYSIVLLFMALVITQCSLSRANKSAADWQKIALNCGETLENATTVLNKQNSVIESFQNERDNFHNAREAFYERKPHIITNSYVMVTVRNMDDWPEEPVYIQSTGTPILTASGFDWEIEIHP